MTTSCDILDRHLRKADGGAVPPKAVQAACRRGLSLAPDYGGEGLTDGARARARAMAAGQAVSPANIQRMANFFTRHQSNRADPSAAEPTPGAVAWLIWGGDAGRTWAESQTSGDDQAEKADTPQWEKKGYVGPGGAWATAKRKAGGKGEAYARSIYNNMTKKSVSEDTMRDFPQSALEYLETQLQKAAAGAGSRGGHIIGTTRSGKPIYASAASKMANSPAAMHRAFGHASPGSGDHARPEHEKVQMANVVMHAHPHEDTDFHSEKADHHEELASKHPTGSVAWQRHTTMSHAHSFAALSKYQEEE